MKEEILKLILLYESDIVKSQTMRKEIDILYLLLENYVPIKNEKTISDNLKHQPIIATYN